MKILQSLSRKFSNIAAYIKLRRSVRRLTTALNAAAGGDIRRLTRVFRAAGEDLSANATAASAMLTAVQFGQRGAAEFFLKRNVPTSAKSQLFRQTAIALATELRDDDMLAMLHVYRARQSRAFLERLYSGK